MDIAMRLSISFLIVLLHGALLAGCGLNKDKPDPTKDWSPQRIYSEAKSEIASGNNDKGIKLLETLQARYPYGRFAQQAQLDEAYAYYKADEVPQALAAADRFIKLHPNHPNVDYAFYLKGLCNFRDDLGPLGFFSTDDLAERDPKAAKDSFDTFRELATRYPESRYTPDAIKRMNYLVNALATHEVKVADYYFRRGAYVAAANRAQEALNTYPQAPALEEALSIMVKSYNAMGLTDLAADASKVLQKNFPQSKFLSGKS
jgi:outer membrane protein assembly factor BamD